MRNLVAALLLTFSLGGWATMYGADNNLAINSSPEGAMIYINGVEQWTTPHVVDLNSFDGAAVIRIELDGYQLRSTR